MPERYHVHVVPTTPRFHRVGKYGNVDWREDCSRCSNCVKLRCLYNVYRSEAAYNRDPDAPVVTLDECKACLSCVQGCTKGLLSVSINPGYLDMGDEYWKSDILLTTWNQADSGKIPVSGAGYRGKFYGYGFDSIWTDMSEIVRPTRDGIHGREYISTSVDIGPKPMRLRFAADGALLTPSSSIIEIPLPVILDVPAWPVECPQLAEARVMAAQRLGTLAVVPVEECAELDAALLPSVAPLFGEAAGAGDLDGAGALLDAVPMVQFSDGPLVAEAARKVSQDHPSVVVAVRTLLTPASAGRIVELAKAGARVFEGCADQHGRERLDDGRPGRHIKDALRSIHGRLVDAGIRDEVTIIVSGGVALAEHMAKAIICGADAVALDTPPLIALGCRVCRDKSRCCSPNACPCDIAEVEPGYAAQRIVNLMGAWHSQLLEVLGAMGIREARRLRGETGRANFMEDIEKEAFGDLCRVSEEQVRS